MITTAREDVALHTCEYSGRRYKLVWTDCRVAILRNEHAEIAVNAANVTVIGGGMRWKLRHQENAP